MASLAELILFRDQHGLLLLVVVSGMQVRQVRRALVCCSPGLTLWQAVQTARMDSGRASANRRILSGSPASACAAPGPWHPSQPCSDSFSFNVSTCADWAKLLY